MICLMAIMRKKMQCQVCFNSTNNVFKIFSFKCTLDFWLFFSISQQKKTNIPKIVPPLMLLESVQDYTSAAMRTAIERVIDRTYTNDPLLELVRFHFVQLSLFVWLLTTLIFSVIILNLFTNELSSLLNLLALFAIEVSSEELHLFFWHGKNICSFWEEREKKSKSKIKIENQKSK